MGKHIRTGGLARGKILGRLAFYTWVHHYELFSVVTDLILTKLLM